jgi:glycosyltransferase involved in cell wall biosynthesis
MKQTILHISSNHSSFDDRIFFKELVSLSKHYNCYLIAGGNVKGMLTTMGGGLVSQGVYDNVTIIPFPRIDTKNIFFRAFRKFFPKVYKIISKVIIFKKLLITCKKYVIQPQIVHFHDLDFFDTAIKIKEYFNARLVFDCHEFYFSYHFNNGLNRINLQRASKSLLLLKNAVQNSDAVISVTRNLDNIISLMAKNDNHIIIYNSSIQPPVTEKREIKDKIVLVHEGSMKFNRGLELMLAIFTDDFFREKTQLKIIGGISGDEKKYFDEKKQEYNIDDSMIDDTGWVPYEKLHQHLTGNIGIIFFEKKFNAYYSMPNKLFNYINAALPILTVHCAELSDFIFYNKIGCVVERNVNAIKEGLHELISNYDYYSENIINIQQSYTWKNDEKRLLELYEHTLCCP